jgi:2-iminoacetate synthase
MTTETESLKKWMDQVIKPAEVEKYLEKGKSFIDDAFIEETIARKKNPDKAEIRAIIAKSLDLQRLNPDETAALLNCTDEDLWQEMYATGLKIKQKVYGRRIVTFAPLYISNPCVNGCVYCGYRQDNKDSHRIHLNMDEIAEEVKALVSKGHKRLIMDAGEHPCSGVDYIADALTTIYKTKVGNGEIRRVNVNIAPMCVADIKRLKEVGIGTFQVFQETYHHATYKRLHPYGLKANYDWRLYALHRSLEAGADDIGIGALFGLYDWKFEVMALLMHTIDLEKKFNNIGPHTISFPRIQPTINTPFVEKSEYKVQDDQFKKLVTVIRLSVPYTGMILTARENAKVRNDVINVGVTQLDAGSNIGIGMYSKNNLEFDKQQFILGDNRSLDELVRDLGKMGYIVSFCTADYRCGRTGKCFMNIAQHGKIFSLCIPNAILTFKEYLLDYASEETKAAAGYLIEKELNELPTEQMKEKVRGMLKEIESGKRDLFL